MNLAGLMQFNEPGRDPRETFAWVLEASRDGVVVCEPNLKVLHANEGACRLLQTSLSHAVGRHLREVWPETGFEALVNHCEAALKERISVEVSHVVLFGDRSTTWSVRIVGADHGLALYIDPSRFSRVRPPVVGTWKSDDHERFGLELAAAIAEIDDPDEIGKVASEKLAQRLSADRGTYALVFPSDRRLELKTGWQISGENIDRSYTFDEVGQELLDQLASGRSVCIADTDEDPLTRDAEPPTYAELGISSLLAVPLVRSGALLAVIALHCRQPRAWGSDEVALTEEVGRRVWDVLERARSAVQVKRLQDRYRTLAETFASVVFSAELDGRLTGLPLLRGLVLTDESAGLGFGWLSAIHPDDRAGAMADWSKAVQTGEPYQTEFRILMQSGRYRWHLARGAQVRDERGLPLEWVGSCTDIHQRVSRERTLKLLDAFTAASRELRTFEQVVMLGQRMLGETLGASRVVYGEPREQGRSFRTVPNYCVDCEDLQGKLPVSGFSSSLSKLLRNGRMIVYDDVAQVPEFDEVRDALMHAGMAAMITHPLLKHGELVSILGVHQTQPREWSSDEVEMVQTFAERIWSEAERAKAEQDLVISAMRLNRLMESATVGVLVNDHNGTITYANAPLLKMLGYEPVDVREGRISWAVLQTPDWVESDHKALYDLHLVGRCDPYESVLRRKDGAKIHVLIGGALIPNDAGPGVEGAAFITDLTPLKSVEDELRALNAELELRVEQRTEQLLEANREMEGFTYSVSHDLRSPLRSIVATSRILMEELGGKLSADESALLDQQARSAKKLGVLIDDLLKLSRLSRDEVLKAPIDLSGLAQTIVQDRVLEQTERSGIEVLIQPGMVAFGDSRHIQLVLWNLLDNAFKFSPDGGKIRCGFNGEAFYVSDEGIGFDMAYSAKLFKPFERLVRDAEFPGTGVGLANVQRIVHRHGGKVWAESAPGCGATFFFSLPNQPSP